MALREHPKILEGLRARYTEQGRHYHDWSHIEHLLTEFDDIKDRLSNSDNVLYAIYYHDAIYDVASATNEEDSAELFEREIEKFESDDAVNCVKAFIVATKAHDIPINLCEKAATDCRFFLDIDMSILGASPVKYDDYARNVRQEYAIYENAAYNFGRAKVLESFLKKDRIFLSDYFFEKYETRARENIERERAKLQAPRS